jgi:hypothetical protein
VTKIGFTGTRFGMSEKQVKDIISVFLWAVEVRQIDHGMCVGADVAFHEIIRKIDPNRIIRIIGHPTSEKYVRKELLALDLECDEVREAKHPLERNHDIVDQTDFMIAAPFTESEVLRSGTWSTIRYARKQGKEVYIFTP